MSRFTGEDTKGMSKEDSDLEFARDCWGCVAATPPATPPKKRIIDSGINDDVVLIGVSIGAGGSGGAGVVGGVHGDG